MSPRHEIQRADPKTRMVAISILVCGAVVGAVLFLLAQAWEPQFRAWATQDPSLAPARGRLILASFGAAIVAPLVAFAVYLWFLGRRILATRRFPPPSMKVLRDTPVLLTKQADVRGQLAQGLALVLVLLALAILTFLYRLAGAI